MLEMINIYKRLLPLQPQHHGWFCKTLQEFFFLNKRQKTKQNKKDHEKTNFVTYLQVFLPAHE